MPQCKFILREIFISLPVGFNARVKRREEKDFLRNIFMKFIRAGIECHKTHNKSRPNNNIHIIIPESCLVCDRGRVLLFCGQFHSFSAHLLEHPKYFIIPLFNFGFHWNRTGQIVTLSDSLKPTVALTN